MIEGGNIVCPWHAWTFDAATGATIDGDERVAVFAVSVEGDEVFVKV
jgi:nitrite reductase/ring-hydroxylating ferredoxin subunit